jgi:hypothetical protein
MEKRVQIILGNWIEQNRYLSAKNICSDDANDVRMTEFSQMCHLFYCLRPGKLAAACDRLSSK